MQTIDVELNANMDEEVANWILDSNIHDRTLAMELGYSMVQKVKNIAVSQATEMISKINISNVPIVSDMPVIKGQVGEAFVENILTKKFGSIANVTKNPKSGDLTLFIQHNKITIEVKNYNNPVPTSGVEKFRRDLNTTNAKGGVFISLKSSITSITSDFTIKYEHCDTSTIPCAYIVSNDENAIIIAVNMISQIISSMDYINTELYNRDKIISGVYGIAGNLDDLSKIRNELQMEIGIITNALSKTTLGLVVAESSIRSTIDKIKSELFYMQTPDILPALAELDSNPNFTKYSNEQRTYVVDVMNCVQSIVHKGTIEGCVWKLSARKCANSVTGISFNFLTAKVEVHIPRSKVPSEVIIKALDTFGKKVSVSDNFCIDLDAITYQWVCKAIRNEF